MSCEQHEATLALALERVKRLEEALREARAGLHRALCVGLNEGQSMYQEKLAAKGWDEIRAAIKAADAALRPEGT